MGFIKGPVCRGQVALNVIDDHFWVVFLDPEPARGHGAEFLARESSNLRLPAEAQQRAGADRWRDYSKPKQISSRRNASTSSNAPAPRTTCRLIWDGDGTQSETPR